MLGRALATMPFEMYFIFAASLWKIFYLHYTGVSGCLQLSQQKKRGNTPRGDQGHPSHQQHYPQDEPGIHSLPMAVCVYGLDVLVIAVVVQSFHFGRDRVASVSWAGALFCECAPFLPSPSGERAFPEIFQRLAAPAPARTPHRMGKKKRRRRRSRRRVGTVFHSVTSSLGFPQLCTLAEYHISLSLSSAGSAPFLCHFVFKKGEYNRCTRKKE